MLLLFAAIGGEAKVYTPSSLPSPKESGQGWYVANPDAIIADSDVVFLNRCAAVLIFATSYSNAGVSAKKDRTPAYWSSLLWRAMMCEL